jgi:hypothetical protein
LKQRDALSPTLLNIVLERVIRDMQEKRNMEILGCTTLLAYTDDIVIFGESRMDLEETVRKLIVTSKNMGLKIN